MSSTVFALSFPLRCDHAAAGFSFFCHSA